jgi:hypothetical protein
MTFEEGFFFNIILLYSGRKFMKKNPSSKVIELKPRIRKPPPPKRDPTGIEYEEELVAPRWLRVSVYSLFIFVIAFFLFSPFIRDGEGDPMYLLLSLVLAGIVWVIHIFFTLRTTLTSEGVKFGFYSFSKFISYDDITDCSVMRYNVMDFIGLGIRKGRDGVTMYNILGDQQIAVKVMVREKDGIKKVFAFSAKRPQVICRRIQAHITPQAKKIKMRPKKKEKASSTPS